MAASAADHLDPAAPVRASISVSVRNAEETAIVSMTFQASGLQLLAPGGRATVNDVELQPQRLQKQGFAYRGQVKRSARYSVQYALGSGTEVRLHEIEDRLFVPELPASVSRSRGMALPFKGPPVGPGERLFLELSGGEGSSRWGVVLRHTQEGGRILVPASALADARLGKAQLYVGISRRDVRQPDSLAVAFGAGSEAAVQVTD